MLRGRPVWTVVVAAIVVISLAAYLYLNQQNTPNLGSTTSTTTEHATTNSTSLSKTAVPVGVFLYLWYGNSTTAAGGLGSPGWNSSSCPGGGAVVDRPSIGYYVSDSNQTFKTQISEMQGAGISFAVVSWWGPFTHGEAGSINRATLDLFKYLKGTNSTFRLAVMVDAFSGTCNPALPKVPMSQAYNYIYVNFAAPYKQWYFDWHGRPLLLAFNPVEPLYNDTRFTSREMGNYACKPVSSCPDHGLNQKLDWIFWQAPGNFSEVQGGTNVNITNDIGAPVISSDGEVTIVPRIDSYYSFIFHYQQGFLRFDSTLQLGMYRYEWNYVLSHMSQVKLVLVYSWNEYHERSAIEPHDDPTGLVPAGYLLNVTSAYVAMLD
jgi:hypothetical protein